MTARASALVNALLRAAMRSSLVIDWAMKQGMHATGTSSPYDFVRAEMRFETTSVSGMLTQDVLLMAGAEDHYVPLEQFSQQLRLLTKARSVTARLFTREEQAQNHVLAECTRSHDAGKEGPSRGTKVAVVGATSHPVPSVKLEVADEDWLDVPVGDRGQVLGDARPHSLAAPILQPVLRLRPPRQCGRARRRERPP